MPIKNVKLGKDVIIPYPDLVNLYGCRIKDRCFIGPFVEIQNDVTIGPGTRIQSHAFICSKTTIGSGVFIGHGVMFINDKYPVQKSPDKWQEINIEDNVVIGSNATILPCRIKSNALVGAGAVVIRDVAENKIVAGNPARVIGRRRASR